MKNEDYLSIVEYLKTWLSQYPFVRSLTGCTTHITDHDSLRVLREGYKENFRNKLNEEDYNAILQIINSWSTNIRKRQKEIKTGFTNKTIILITQVLRLKKRIQDYYKEHKEEGDGKA